MKWTPQIEQVLINLASLDAKENDWQDIADKLNQIDPKKHFSIVAIKLRYRQIKRNSCLDVDNELTLRQIMRKKSKTEYQRLYRLQNEDHYRAHYKKYNKSKKFKDIKKAYRQKKSLDPNFKLANVIRISVHRLLISKNNIKSKTLNLTRDQLRNHIESKFDKYLNFENYGKLWTLKYIITLESFDLQNEEEFKKACSLDNITIRIK